jgi:hypothetical protein
VRRRWLRGLCNLFDLYLPLATTWRIYDASKPAPTRPVAFGRGNRDTVVLVEQTWRIIHAQMRTLCGRRDEETTDNGHQS